MAVSAPGRPQPGPTGALACEQHRRVELTLREECWPLCASVPVTGWEPSPGWRHHPCHVVSLGAKAVFWKMGQL